MQAERSFTGQRFALARLLRSLLTPLTLALPPLFWVVSATDRASRTPLGRDQGIFQYIAWALRQGEVDYRDVRDVNGPLTHLVHVVFLALGGADDHRFRVLDLLVTGVTFAFVGACVPGLRSPRSSPARRGPPRVERAAWAFAGWVVLSGQYLLYGYWDLAQRESFFDWFMLPSVALQLVALAPPPRADAGARARDAGPTRQARLLAVVGALSWVPWFGKPTFALFTLAQLAVLVVSDELVVPRKRAVGAFIAGGAAASVFVLALLALYGDPLAYLRVQLADVPAMYRFIWPRAAADILSIPWTVPHTVFAIGGATVLGALVALGEMPRRALALAALPLCALAGVIVQAKGFPYHFHPVTAAIALQWIALAAWATDRARVAQRRWAAVRLVPLALALVFAVRVATMLADSPHIRAAWLLWSGYTPASRSTREYFAQFPEVDFFPYEMRQAAAYLRKHTKPTDRVQAYGMDPYVLFLAERLSATPYIYAYDLDADAALAGGTGAVPDDRQAERIRAIRDAHERDLFARIQAHPPAAFVFLDQAPLTSRQDGWQDFAVHCREAAPWVAEHYRETARFGHDHVWLRSDLAPAVLDDGADEGGDEVTTPGGP